MASSPTKFEALLAVFDSFYRAISDIDDENVRRLVQNWNSVKLQYGELQGKVRISELVGGLEQGLRETPQILQRLQPKGRAQAIEALRAAIAEHYPRFYSRDSKRLATLLKLNHVACESDYYLLRHAIDDLEGTEQDHTRLQQLYKLCDEYEHSRTTTSRTPGDA